MKNPIKSMWIMLAAALVMAAGTGCASHLQKGLTALTNKDYDKAIANVTKDIRSNPRNPKAYYGRGDAYFRKGQYDKAIADYSEAIRMASPNASLYNSRCWTYALKGDFDNAIEDCNQAIQLDSKDANIYHSRGFAYLGKKDYDNAIADFEVALQIDPNLKEAKDDLAKAKNGTNPTATKASFGAASFNNAATAADDELDIAIRDASDYLNDNIPKGSKIVILNVESNSANLSEYIIDELIANAVNDKNFSVVDRRQLEAIQSEQKFQMSGAVDDKDALAIGKFFGAQTIISGAMRDIGPRYRLTIRALSVQTAQVQGQYNRNMAVSEMLAGLAGSGGAWSRPNAAPSTTAGRTMTAASPAPVATPVPRAAPAIQGTPVQGSNLTEKLDWLQENAESGGNYLVELNANETIAPKTLSYSGKSKITITLAGIGANRSVFLSANGSMFTVGPDITLVLENNVTLQGRSQNSGSLVYINGGTLRMNAGATITGNTKTYDNGGGVYMENGIFTMNGGTVSDNTAHGGGGGIYIKNGAFTINDGIISGNTASEGGGIHVFAYYNLTKITFNMNGGNIIGNTASGYGGGVYVRINQGITFNKSGGTITGYADDDNNGNRTLSSQKRGHAVYLNCGNDESASRRKEGTVGPNMKISFNNCQFSSGGWDGNQ